MAGVDTCWVGAKGLDGTGMIIWERSGSIVSGMWSQGEPDSNIGDCVKLDGGSSKLSMGDCDTALSFLCEIF